jgi:magnesium transporter
MPRTLLFDESNIPNQIQEGYVDSGNNLSWINLKVGEAYSNILPEIIDTSKSFTDDLVEEQRPRIAKYQTLEDNDDTFSVIVFSLPTRRLFTEDEFQLQISFVLLDHKIYSLPSAKNSIISEIMAKISTTNTEYTISDLFIYIITELLEMSIKILFSVTDYIDNLERQVIKREIKKGWVASLLVLKGRLFDASKLVKADIEHIREILEGLVPEIQIDPDEISDHVLDRGLFLMDQIETSREEMSNIINLHLAIASNDMNMRFYWLTILGSILIIPTIISSIWGMNVPVPQWSFEIILLFIFVLTVIAALGVKYLMPKPFIH